MIGSSSDGFIYSCTPLIRTRCFEFPDISILKSSPLDETLAHTPDRPPLSQTIFRFSMKVKNRGSKVHAKKIMIENTNNNNYNNNKNRKIRNK